MGDSGVDMKTEYKQWFLLVMLATMTAGMWISPPHDPTAQSIIYGLFMAICVALDLRPVSPGSAATENMITKAINNVLVVEKRKQIDAAVSSVVEKHTGDLTTV